MNILKVYLEPGWIKLFIILGTCTSPDRTCPQKHGQANIKIHPYELFSDQKKNAHSLVLEQYLQKFSVV